MKTMMALRPSESLRVAAPRRALLARLFASVLVMSPLGDAAAAGQSTDPHAEHRRAMQAPVTAGSTSVTLPSVVLHDAQGKPFKLRPESFRGRVVVIDFIYTSCTTICPALTSVMASVQRGLGRNLGKDAMLVSISVDPARDTPDVMRAYAKRVGAGKDWLWLTGSSGDITRVLRAFGLSAGKPDDHPPLILVGDPARGRWLRWVGVPTPAAITEGVHGLLAETAPTRVPKSAPIPDTPTAHDPNHSHAHD